MDAVTDSQDRPEKRHSQDPKRSGRRFLPIRVRFPFPVAFVTLVALIMAFSSGVTGFFGYRGEVAAVNRLMESLQAELTEKIQQHLDRYMDTPHLLNALNADAIQASRLEMKDPKRIARHFMKEIARFDSIFSINYGDDQGEFVGIVRDRDGGDALSMGVSGKATGHTLVTRRIDRDGNLLDPAWESIPGYDPRQRPWYAAASGGGPAWTEIKMSINGDVGLDAVLRIRTASGREGVLDTSLSLRNLGNFLNGLKVSDRGQIFILERSGALVAASSIPEPFGTTGGVLTRMYAASVDDPVIRSAAARMAGLGEGLQGIDAGEAFRFASGGESFVSQVTPYANAYGLDWLIVTAIPDQFFMAGVEEHTAVMVTMLILCFFASILLTVLVTRSISRPLRRLNSSLQRVATGEWEDMAEIHSWKEIENLACSFNTMSDRLKGTFSSLMESEEKFRVLSEQSHIGVCIVQEGRVHYMNRTFSDVTGWRQMDDMKRGFPDDPLLSPETSLISEMQRLSLNPQDFKETVQASNLCLKTPRGDRWYSVFLKTVHLHDKPAGMAALVDITDEVGERAKARDRQKQLIQAEKLASLGVLVAGVAHEINSPNQAILLSSQVVKDAWPQLTEILEEYMMEHGDFMVGGAWYSQMRQMIPNCLDAIGKCSNRIESIVTDLKDYARHDPTESFHPVDVNLVITSALSLTSVMLKKTTRNLGVALGADLPPVQGNFQRLEQVIVNLVQNACQALQNPAQSIRVASRYIAEKRLVEVEIEDQGRGIPAQDMQMILDPFFTTKRDTGGTGLGLSVSHTIVEQHGGRMEFSSQEGAGTTVTVRLPALTA